MRKDMNMGHANKDIVLIIKQNTIEAIMEVEELEKHVSVMIIIIILSLNVLQNVVEMLE